MSDANLSSGLTVRDATPADEADWRRLWDGYVRFYEASVSEDVTAHTWRRILDPATPMFTRLACRDGAVIGFSNSVLHEGTWVATPICYLEDLFVDPAARGSGAGRALIQDLIDMGRARGWSRLYWHTRQGNETARALYDRFVAADDFVRYRIPLG